MASRGRAVLLSGACGLLAALGCQVEESTDSSEESAGEPVASVEQALDACRTVDLHAFKLLVVPIDDQETLSPSMTFALPASIDVIAQGLVNYAIDLFVPDFSRDANRKPGRSTIAAPPSRHSS